MKPLIVQSDMTLLLEVESPAFEETRDAIAPFAEIIKSPDHIHTYRITPLSLWNAGAAGMSASQVLDALMQYTKFPISEVVLIRIKEIMERFGSIEMRSHSEGLSLSAKDTSLMHLLRCNSKISNFFARDIDEKTVLIQPINRGLVKQTLIKEGWPVLDLAGYEQGKSLEKPIDLRADHALRPYQQMASSAFGSSGIGGSGVIVLPCGAGKTITGISILTKLQCHTLVLTTGTTAVRQWKQELLDKTTIEEQYVGEYSGEVKEIRPITVSTYQILTSRQNKEADFVHFDKINAEPWGLIIYDEVHLLPAQVFQFTASLQAVRRLGLTATLVREDGREEDVFSLIGPKYFDVPWKDIEKQGWIAPTTCFEIRVPLCEDQHMDYAKTEKRHRFRIASENSNKFQAIESLLKRHPNEPTLIIGQFIDQIEKIAQHFQAPLITGKTPQEVRDVLYAEFKTGKRQILVVSSVANFALDLPNATVAIQVSGKFGSRQEEAQRLGRLLRPQAGKKAYFYTIVTADTEEQDFAFKRQLFLVEQGYTYKITADA